MFSTKALRSMVLLFVLLAAPSLSSAIPIVFTDVDSIVVGVSAFRDAIGGVNNGNAAGPFTTGRREINWDGGGAAAPVLTDMPKDLFQNNRGAVFSPATTTFSISGAPNPRFGNINPTYPSTFSTFSEPRLFAPTNSIVTEQTFTVPGSKLAATTTAFGAVFTNVQSANTTSIQLFDPAKKSLGTFFAPTSAAGGLSFLGVSFKNGELIDRVVITTGNTILGPNNGGAVNVVAMDDFIYGEPQAASEPMTLLLVAGGAAMLLWGRERLRAAI
ncbi:MAG: hypothetical protein NW701_18830 [Nitrospira sp.]